jgi:methyl-accepting chemotaxis protein
VRIRFKILLACLALTSVTVGLGLFVLQGQRGLGDLAMKIYDDAVMSISYARSAETKFAELRGQLALSDQKRAAADQIAGLHAAASAKAVATAHAAVAAPQGQPEQSERQAMIDIARGGKMVSDVERPGEISERQALLAAARAPVVGREAVAAEAAPVKDPANSQPQVDKAIAAVLDDLDVAIERAMSQDGRGSAKALRESIAGISSTWKGPGAAKRIEDVAGAFDQLVEQYAADGLQLRSNAEEMVAQGVRSTEIAIGASVAIALLITWVLTFTIVPALRRAARIAEDIADGRLDNVIVLPKRRGSSEAVALLVALSRMQKAILESLQRSEGLSAEKAEAEQTQARLRKAEMSKFADDFESAVGDIIDTVSSASSELESSAGMLTATAERSQALAAVVAEVSEEASVNVRSVASASEKMASSVNDISRQVQDSARIASEAVVQAHKTNDRVAALSKAASRIGDVVELINTIAGQTNLLALNATIEAARADEAGRGFAVVASEVKALAQQTAKATEEISQQIGGIQAATEESVAAIREIGDTIGQMSQIASIIAASVEEQGAANQEISHNVSQAAHGTQQVSANISDVQRGAGETGSASTQVLSAAQSLARESNRLKGEVKQFLDTVRAA